MSKKLIAITLTLFIMLGIFLKNVNAAISSISQNPAASAVGTGSVTVTWTQTQACNSGQIWYWINDPNHSSNNFTGGTRSGSGPYTWSATIPAQSAGTVIEYQLQNWNDCTEEFDTNGGLFYGYGASASSTQTYHTIHVNGDLVDWRSNEQLGTANGVTYYLTWDANYFYVGFSGGNANSDKYTILFDVDPTQNNGATSAFGGANFPANGAPDYAVQWRGSSNNFWFATGNSSGWTGAEAPSSWSGDLYGKDNGNTTSGVVELRIARSKVGLSTTTNVFAIYLIASNSGDNLWSAFPSNNPQTSGSNLTTAQYYYSSKSGVSPKDDAIKAPWGGVNVAALSSTDYGALQYNNQRKVVFINGKWWALYRDSSDATILRLASSTDGVNWNTTTLYDAASNIYQPSLWVDDTIIHVAFSTNANGLYYSRIDTTTGTTKFTQSVLGSASGDLATAITHSTNGQLWIMQANSNSGKIFRSEDLGNTWTESLTGLDSGSFSRSASLLPLRDGKLLAFYVYGNSDYRYRVWDGLSSWSSAASAPGGTDTPPNTYDFSGTIDYLNNAYVLYKRGSTTLLEKYDGSSWSEISNSALAGDGTPYNSIDVAPVGDIYRSYRGTGTQLRWSKYTSSWSTAINTGYSTTSYGYNAPTCLVNDRYMAVWTYRASDVQAQFHLLDILTAPRVPSHIATSSTGVYAFAKTADTTPSFRFSSSDPGRDDVRYQIQIDDDPLFGSTAVDATSNTDIGFIDITSGGTDPFNSGNTIEYTVQSALSDGTYYWRVRAIDPNGVNKWSGWSRARQFTVDTSIDIPTWHQNFGSSGYAGSIWISEPIVLTDIFGSSANWGEVYWEDAEPSGADVKVSVWYTHNDGYLTRVPNEALPGNSSGFGNNFIDLSGLSTSAYGTLYLRADLSGSNAKLYRWSVTAKSTSETSQTISRNLTSDANSVYSFGETGVTISFSDNPPNTTCTAQVIVHRNQTPTEWTNTAKPVKRYYEITTTGCGDFSASLALAYPVYQLNGNTESTLKMWKYGTAWDSGGGTVNTTEHIVTRSAITSFSKWALSNNNPTAITLAAFSATPQGDAIRVIWETAAELDNLGFHLYRSASASGPWTRLNATLIPPQFPGQIYGGIYEWLDTEVTPGVMTYYRLEDVDRNGARTFHGPVWAVMGGARYRVYLPLVVRP